MGYIDYIQLHSGKKFHYNNYDPAEIHAVDIAHALARCCRYAGHTMAHYSVAEHCIILTRYALAETGDLDLALWALLHDGTEAYIPDIPRPLKNLPGMEAFIEMEDKIMHQIAVRFQLKGHEIPEWVHTQDKLILHDEALQVFDHPPVDDWHLKWAPGIGATIKFYSEGEAEILYFNLLTDLLRARIDRDAREAEG